MNGGSHAGGIALDGSLPEREGEALDRDRLAAYLTETFGSAERFAVEQFPSGFSNLTYRVVWGERDLVLRRPPFGSQVATAHDMLREHAVLARLSPLYPRAPRPLAACADPAVLGAPFFLMERIAGVILRGDLRAATLAPMTPLAPAMRRRVDCALVAELAALHRLDVAAGGLAELGRPEGYLERQVAGWTKRSAAATVEPLPELVQAFEWLGRRGAELARGATRIAMVHNDFKHDNLVLDPGDLGTIRAVLDWEMATIGDPRLDLGTTLGYWSEAGDPAALTALGFAPAPQPGSLTRREVVALYCEAIGNSASGDGAIDAVFAYVFGLAKIATIAQQIHVRYLSGATRDPRFAALGDGVHALARHAADVLDRDRV
mgnify:CR=1 FL=1